MHTNNGAEVWKNTDLKVKTICGTNYTITRSTNENVAYSKMFYIDTGSFEQTFSAWTSTAESICPIQKYELYSTATNTSSYKLAQSHYNMPNTNTTTISFTTAFTSNILRNPITFYVRAEWLGTGIHAGGGKY